MKSNKIITFFENESAKQKAKVKNSRDPAYFKSAAYLRIANILRETFHNNEILTSGKINKLPITDSMKKKIIMFINNPSLLRDRSKRTNKKKNSEHKILLGNLTKLMGIGVEKAKELIDNGLTDIKQIRNKKYLNMLTDQTRIYLSLKPEKRISHKEISILEPIIMDIKKNRKKLEIIIVGSYRRKTRFSKDIDIMVVSDDKDILEKIIKILIKDYEIIPYIIGIDKISFIIAIAAMPANIFAVPNRQNAKMQKYYKIDMFRTSFANKWAMLLYSTGPKNHNIKMRSIAKKKGLLLNQQGLYDRKTKKLISKNVKSEKYFFNKLGLEYKTPEERY